MTMNHIQAILPMIEKPSRYLGTEINSIRKDHSQVKLTMALAFPDLYDIGTSHFGIQILYHILNNQKDIAAERVFAPSVDLEERLRAENIPLTSLETQTPLNRFDVIGFSLLYELNYTNILTMLNLCGIPFLAQDRNDAHPLIIAGGPCACNPEPLADIFDAMVIGDGEHVIIEMTNIMIEFRESGGTDKSQILNRWSRIEGVYIPSLFELSYDAAGFQHLTPLLPDYSTITKAVVADLNDAPFPASPVVPFGKPVHDRLRIEIARGCTRGCRFCQAGMIYRPVRERRPESLLSIIDRSLKATGYEDLSLLSLSAGDYGCIAFLTEQIMAAYASSHVAVSLPSLRAGTLTPQLMSLIKRVRKTGFTIAPEAGSQRLRNVINKNITEADVIETVKDAFELGWQVIKLYFMIGLPTETDADAESLIRMVKELKKIKGPRGRKGKLNVSISTFIPKPHTPFQWASQMTLAESKEKIGWFQDQLKLPGVDMKWQRPELSYLEGLWARGDRRLSRLLIRAYQKGCRFDGWSDHFRFSFWEQAISEEGIDVDFFTSRTRNSEEPLPWDHVTLRLSKDFLKNERRNALNEELTDDCRSGDCNACGVCDFDTVQPVVFSECRTPVVYPAPDLKKPLYRRLKISYSKTDNARFFGHLELLSIMVRAFRKAGVPVQYSEGFHPMPKLSFDDPLPVGMESLNSVLFAQVGAALDPDRVMTLLNMNLPEGLRIRKCDIATSKKEAPDNSPDGYDILLQNPAFDSAVLDNFLNSPEFEIIHTNRKGNIRQINLKEKIIGMELIAPNHLKMSVVSEQGFSLRPADAIRKIFQLSDEDLLTARIIKL